MLRLKVFALIVSLLGLSGLTLNAQTNRDPNLAALKVQAEEGDAEAQYRFANTFRDREDFIMWLRKSADQHYPPAMEQLATFLMGRLPGRTYLSASYDEGIIWAAWAADLGSSRSTGLLAEGFYYGRGVERDHEMAYYWLVVAERHPGGRNSHGSMETRLLQSLPIDAVRNARERAQELEAGKSIAAEIVLGSVLERYLRFTGTMERGGETIALINDSLVATGQEFTVEVGAGAFKVICVNVAHDEIHFAVEGTQAPVVLRRLLEAP